MVSDRIYNGWNDKYVEFTKDGDLYRAYIGKAVVIVTRNHIENNITHVNEFLLSHDEMKTLITDVNKFVVKGCRCKDNA